jgi:hypothetical protein
VVEAPKAQAPRIEGPRPKSAVDAPQPIVDTVAEHWTELFPGIEILDRDLRIGPEQRIPLVAADGAGRLVLALPVSGDREEDSMLVLDVLAWMHEHEGVLARHVDRPAPKRELPSAVWVIAPRLERPFLAKLRAVQSPALRAFELVAVDSRRGRRTHVAEVPLGDAPAAAEAPRDEIAFFASLPREPRALGELLVRRLARLDDELGARRHAGALEWRLRDELVCGVSLRGEALEAEVPDTAGAARLASTKDVERLLDRAVHRYLVLRRAMPIEGARAAQSLRDPILTPEELAAFEP